MEEAAREEAGADRRAAGKVSGGNDALPADQLDHAEKKVEIIVDHTVLPDVVTDALPVRGRF